MFIGINQLICKSMQLNTYKKHNLYLSTLVRVIKSRSAVYRSLVGEMKNANRIFFWQRKGKTPLGGLLMGGGGNETGVTQFSEYGDWIWDLIRHCGGYKDDSLLGCGVL
jgi:hypothetical protein